MNCSIKPPAQAVFTHQMMNQRVRFSSASRWPVWLPKVIAYTLLGGWALVCLFPIYWVAVFSLKDERAIVRGPFFLPFVDFTPTLESWHFILFDENDSIPLRFFNSLSVAMISTALTLLLGGMAVYGVTRFRRSHFGGDGLLYAMLATRLLPPAVVVLPLFMLANTAGLVDTRFALIVTYTATNLPVAIWLLRPVVGSVATDQEEAAQLDGASRFGIFFTIFLPMIATGVAAVGLLIFILCWNEYLFAVYLTTDHALTLPPFLAGQLSMKEAATGGETVEWARLSAATVVMVVPLLAFAGLAQRFLGRLARR